MIRISINGDEYDSNGQETILNASIRVGIRIPTLCFDPRFEPIGSCRVCCVDVEGENHAQIACHTQVYDGMRIATHTPAIEDFRRTILEWEAAKVRPSSFAEEPDKELHRLLRAYDADPKAKGRRRKPLDLSHPHIRVDMSQCISCLRCVRICEDVQGQFVWHALDRGTDMHIVPDSGTTLGTSSCVGCGACVDTCPTGALTDRSKTSGVSIDWWTRTTCVYCGVGCEMEVGVSKERVVRTRPVIDAPVSKGHLCVKGRYAFSFNDAPDRQGFPLTKFGKRWVPLSWDDALEKCAGELKRISAAYGPDSIGVLGSARVTNEENYLAQKFARVVLGTNNVDCCARVCHTPSAAALKAMLGAGAATNSFNDIERSNTIFIFGANPLENHPIVGARIRQHVLKHGANLIVADPRNTEIAMAAKLHLRLRPGTNIPLLNALAQVIVTEELVDHTFLQDRVAEWDGFCAFIRNWPVERAQSICGIPADDIRNAARLYATAKPSISFHGLGLTEHTQGTEGVMALINLALITGNIGKPGTGINPLRGQNNVQGAAHMGCDPSTLTGSVTIDERRANFETIWDAPIPRSHGHHLLSMMDEAIAGRLKALWVIGYDVLPTLANVTATRRAFRNLEFVIVQDLFITKTAEAAATIFLPAASVFEKDGTFMNGERRVQRVRKATEPPGEARTDWQIICALAQRMGHGARFNYTSAKDIWNEIRLVWPEGAGMTYERLEQQGLQWPCRSESDPGVSIFHGSEFAHTKRAALRRIDYIPTPEGTSTEFPLLLSTGRNLYQFNAGTMTMRTANIKIRRTDTLDISPADAAQFNVKDGQYIRVRSRYGSVRMIVRITDAVNSGELFATFHDPRVGLNKLTGPFRDSIVQTPEYKVTAVRIETLER